MGSTAGRGVGFSVLAAGSGAGRPTVGVVLRSIDTTSTRATARLYDLHGAAAYSLGLSLLGEADAAEDVVVAAFVGALRDGALPTLLTAGPGAARGALLQRVEDAVEARTAPAVPGAGEHT